MTETDPLLDRAAIQEAFRRLGDRLARRGVVADICVIGGAAMALAYDARRSTRDAVSGSRGRSNIERMPQELNEGDELEYRLARMFSGRVAMRDAASIYMRPRGER